MASRAEAIAEALGTSWLVCDSYDSPDLKAFVEALKPFASIVFSS